jgi:hypothetical protein
MRGFFLIAIIAALIASGVFAVLYFVQYSGIAVTSMDERRHNPGNGIVREKPQEVATENAFAGASGFTWKDRLQKAIEDCVRAIKNLSTSVRHRISPRLAPDGVYFTMRYFSLPNAHGITGIAPGTKVVRVRDNGSMLRVRTGSVEFEAAAQDLTNDLDVADSVSKADVQNQKAVADYFNQQRAIHQAQQHEQDHLLDQQQRDLERRTSKAAPAWSNPLEKGAYNRPQDNRYTDQNGRTYWIDIRGHRHYDDQ